ncbi:MAG: PAS domain S-box protein [Ferruginibacter sp.]
MHTLPPNFPFEIADLAVLDGFAGIVENLSDAILTRDAGKRITSWNKGAELLFGYKRDEAIGKTAHELGMIRFTADEMHELDESLEKSGSWKAEKEYYHRDGRRLYGAVSANVMRDESGKIGSVVFIIRDITLQKELESHLKEYNEALTSRVEEKTHEVVRNERRYRAIIENNNDLTSLIDVNGRILYRSPSAERTTGWTNAELNELATLQQLIHPDDLDGFRKRMDIAKTNPGQPIDNLFRVRHKDGHYTTQKGTITNLLHNEDIKAFIINCKDITEQVEREKELQKNRDRLFERERLLALYIEHSPVAIAMFDMHMRYLVVSRRWIADYQLEGQELIGRCHYDVFPEMPDEYKAVHQRCLKGISDRKEEDLFVRINGNFIWVRWEVLPWYNASGEIGGILIFTEDITKRKLAEESISVSEQKYRSLVDRVSDGFISLDNNCAFNFVNPVAAAMFGRNASDMLGKIIWNEFPETIGSATSEAINLAMRTQKHVRLNEISISGQRWVEANLYPSETGLSVFLRDITRQHNALVAAQHSEAYRKKIMGSALDAIICAGHDEIITSCNPQALRMFGFAEEEIIGKKLTDTIILEKFRQRHSAGIKHYLATGEGSIMNKLVEVSALNKAGNEFPIEMFIVPIEEKGEQFFCAFIRDISVRKKAESEILKTQKRFIQAEQIGRMGHWEIDLVQNRSRWSDEAYRIHGLEPDDHNISSAEWLTYVHPDDRAYVEEQINKGMQHGEGTSFSFRIIRKDGSIRYLYSEYLYELDQQGIPTGMYGIVHDITEQKELEFQLQEQQRKEMLHLSAATLSAQEKERNAIGRELHDNVNQILVGSLLVLSMIKKKPEQAIEYAATAIDNLQLAVNENRKIAHELVAPDFQKEPFTHQLEKLSETMLEPAGIRSRLDLDQLEESLLSDAQKLALYRVAQEQCTNIIKYSEAGEATIRLESTNKLLYMCIADDGKGMDDSKRTDGIGLKNIQSRVSVFNGDVSVTTAPGKGFSLEVAFPLHA